MSYNTRRTPAGRGSPGTQVNYHQQPVGRQSSNSQSRNPGYSTQQPAFQTTPPQSFSSPQGTPVAAVPAKPAQQPPVPSTPAPPAQAAPPVKTPTAVKQEPPTPQDTPKAENSTENGDTTPGGKPPFWVNLKKRPTVKVSNKVKRARQNAKLRRILNPKNALTFLNELKPGAVKFTVKEETGWGFAASVDIDGKTFTGHALNVSKAKVVASEQALKHLLLQKLAKTQEAAPTDAKEAEKAEEEDEPMELEQGEGEEPKAKKQRVGHPEDEMPWGSLAAFALHKLFAEWQSQGAEEVPVPEAKAFSQQNYEEEPMVEEPYFTRRPGPPPPEYGYPPRRMPPPGMFGRGRGFAPYPPRGPPPPHFGGPVPRRPPPPAAFSPRSAFPLPGGAPLNMQPMKKIPEDATKRHPVMLLNQLKPNLVYQETKEGELPNVFFKISVNLDNKEFVGRGKSKKEAKKNAAKEALASLGIVYEGDQF